MAQRQGALTPPGIGRGIEGEKVPGARKGWTRREFLKAVGIGAAAVATGGALAAGAKVLEGMQDSGGSLPEPGLPPTPKPPEPTTAPTGPSQAPTVETPTTQPTKTETPKPTETATPKPTETPKPTPTPEAPFFKDRTEEGRKNGIFRFYTPDGKPRQKIDDPETSTYSKYDGGIHWMYVHLPGYERALVRGARVTEKNEQTRVLTLKVGDGTVQRKFTNKTISCLFPHVYQDVALDEATKCGGNSSDVKEGDLIYLWAPETPAGHDNLASTELVDAFGTYAVQ